MQSQTKALVIALYQNLEKIMSHWNFSDASRRKFLCFFLEKITNSATEVKNAITLKRLKVETWILELRWGIYELFFVQSLEAIGHVIRISELKTEMPIRGLTLYIPGYFYTLFVPGGGANFPPLSKNRLVSDRSKIFCMLKVFFVKFSKIKILRFWRHANNDDVIKTSKSL